MPRQLRIEYPGAIYHVMSRGDRWEDIFHDEMDRQDFLKTLAEACQKADFQIHAYCLMRHHFHLVVETPNGNLVAGMRWLLSSYTLRLNHRRKLFVHVKGGDCGTVASGNHVDDPRDCRAVAHGQLEECHHPAAKPETKQGTT